MSEDLKNVLNMLRPFDERRERAKERLDGEQFNHAFFFAVLGLSAPEAPLALGSVASLRRVSDPPGEIELAGAMRNKSMMSAVARYARSVGLELCVNREHFSDEEKAMTFAWWVITALRVRVSPYIIVPLAANYSWSTIAGAPDGSCEIRLIEDVPLAHRFAEPRELIRSDMDWIASHLASLASLLEETKFRMAIESLTEHHLQKSLRMAIAHLWAGVEALLSISSELRFRISAYIAAYLEPYGPCRLETFKRVRGLYDFRSKAVHGASLGEKEMRDHIAEVHGLLSRIVVQCIENGSTPSADLWDELLLSGGAT